MIDTATQSAAAVPPIDLPESAAAPSFDLPGTAAAPVALATAPVPAREPTINDLKTVMNVPVRMRAVLGRARLDLRQLLRMRQGDVLDLDRRAGEPVDIYVNDRFVARGEVVLIDDSLGVTLTEIAHQDR